MVSARDALNKATTEDELLTVVTEALELFGYVWCHVRRSDKALTMGHQGVPDIIAARRGRVVFLELKTEKGHSHRGSGHGKSPSTRRTTPLTRCSASSARPT